MRHDLEGTKFNGPWMCATDVSAFASNFQTWEPEVLMLISVGSTYLTKLVDSLLIYFNSVCRQTPSMGHTYRQINEVFRLRQSCPLG